MKRDPTSRTRVRFGIFEADFRSGELRRDGLKVKIQELPFQVLVALLERPGEVLPRENLRKRLWPADTFVDFEQGLNKAINKLREALGDDAGNPRFVETLPRRGYRFIGPAEAVAGSHDRRPNTFRIIALSAGVIVSLLVALLGLNVGGLRSRVLREVRTGGEPPLQIHSIAVLPVKNLSGDPDQEYFADGMTEELITELSGISDLRVIGRTSVMVYKGSNKPIREIASALNVDLVLEASVLRSGNRVQINAHLVDGSTERILWKETFERNLVDIFALYSAVAGAVTVEVSAALTPQEQQHLASAKPVNPRAYDAYLRGRYLWNKRTGDDIKKGLTYFEKAVQIDPNYAPAYAGIADSYEALVYYGAFPPSTAYAKARVAAQRAVALDDNLAEGHITLGQVYLDHDWNWSAARKEIERGIDLNPNYSVAHQRRAGYLLFLGRLDEALAEIEKAQKLDPLSRIISAQVGLTLFFRGHYDLAIKQGRRTEELDPHFWSQRSLLGWAYLAKGSYEDAVRELKLAVDLSKGHPSALGWLGYGYAVSGEKAKARRILATLQRKAKGSYVPPFEIAVVCAGLGEKDQAFAYLEKAIDEHYFPLLYLNLKRFPLWVPLHSDPRYRDLLRRMNFPS